MSILGEIYSWSQNLPPWQQDAVARLYGNRQLGEWDWDDLYALAKQEAGIADPQNRHARKLPEAQVASPPVPTHLVQLTAIKQLSNVNALVDGGSLPIARDGLTVIYGENGAGKSGYSRALKHACRARDQREPILPNAKVDPSRRGRTKAVFETVIDGQTVDLPWEYQGTAPEPLSEISIFDTHCARAYIDNEGDFAYTPYGLDILAGLVAACNKIKERAAREKMRNAPNDIAFAALAKEQTAVGRAVAGIARLATRVEEIERLAAISDTEMERLGVLVKAMAESAPKQKAQALRQKASRLEGLSNRMSTAWTTIDLEKVSELERLVRAANAAKRSAELAACEFNATPGQLAGTGGDEWKARCSRRLGHSPLYRTQGAISRTFLRSRRAPFAKTRWVKKGLNASVGSRSSSSRQSKKQRRRRARRLSPHTVSSIKLPSTSPSTTLFATNSPR